MVEPPLSVDSSRVTVAVVVPATERVHIQLAVLLAKPTHDPTASPLVGLVPAVTVSRAHMLEGAPVYGKYHGAMPDDGTVDAPPPPPVSSEMLA